MKKTVSKISWIITLAVMVLSPAVFAQEDRDDDSEEGRSYESESFQRRTNDDDRGHDKYGEPIRIDRYLDVQVWPNRDDAEYYVGDNIVINFRANRDCFVVIYSVDSRGRVNLLFPANPSDDNYVSGGVTYHLPSGSDRFDLVVDGPSGREQIQMIASREKFPIPNWYRNSGIVCDSDDRDEFMDNLNERYFVRYPGQRFGLDRAMVFVNEWEPDYYRPIYSPYYPNWAVTGNVYIDYPWGGSVYMNGIYWGVAPLYIPRLVVGWHVITIYDPWGYCWESDFHANRYHTVVFDRTVVKTSRVIESRFKEVRVTKWRDPIRSGYPEFKAEPGKLKAPRGTVAEGSRVIGKGEKLGPTSIDSFQPTSKKYARGETKLVKTERGLSAEGEVKGIRPTQGSSYGKSRRTADQSGDAPTTEKARVREFDSPTYKQRGGSVDNGGSTSGRVEKRRGAEPTRVEPTRVEPSRGEPKRVKPSRIEPSRVEPALRDRVKLPSGEQRREQPRVEKKSGGESVKNVQAPTVKESPKPQPSSDKQAQPSSPSKSKGDDNKIGKGKRP